MESENETAFMGKRHEWGGDLPFGLEPHERRQHLYVIGQTGTGKSTLLRNLILQDIEAGRGVGLIDPHGDLAHDILDHIPPWRTDDIVYFDPSAPDPLAINLFRATSDNWHLVASGIVSAFKKIWGDSWGPRLASRTGRVSVREDQPVEQPSVLEKKFERKHREAPFHHMENFP
jgi:energy-coupling factor transporter ATP-binding protein EcfA2